MDLDAIMLRLSKLEEVEKIKELRQYHLPQAGQPADGRDLNLDLLMELITDDAELEYPGTPFGRSQGREAIRAGAEKDPVSSRFALYVPAWIRVDDDLVNATGRWTMFSLGKVRDLDGNHEPVVGAAYYDDVYMKEDGRWKIKKWTSHMRLFFRFEEGWRESSLQFDRFFKT